LKGQQMYNKTTRTGGADTCPITFWGALVLSSQTEPLL